MSVRASMLYGVNIFKTLRLRDRYRATSTNLGVHIFIFLWVQLSVSAGNGWPHNALRHHWLMPISCHFRDCKELLVTSLTHVSGAVTSLETFTPVGWSLPSQVSLTSAQRFRRLRDLKMLTPHERTDGQLTGFTSHLERETTKTVVVTLPAQYSAACV